MKPEEIKYPGDISKHLGEIFKPPEPEKFNLSDFFSLINKAHEDLQKLLPELCEVCEKPAWECECEDCYV